MNTCITEVRPDSYIERAYAEWEQINRGRGEAAFASEAERDADDRAAAALRDFLEAQATTPEGLLFKLRVALDFDDYLFTALDSRNHYVAPRVIVSVAHDLQAMILREHAAATPPRMAQPSDIL